MSVAVIGGGSWATALVKILSDNQHSITWWVRRARVAEKIRSDHHNPDYLSQVHIDVSKVKVTNQFSDAIRDAATIILAVPSAFLQDVLVTTDKTDFKTKIVFSAIKGIVPDKLMIVGEYLNKYLDVQSGNIGVITGPCHAEEVAMEKLSYLTIACSEIENARKFAAMLQCRYIRTTISDDIYGTEYAAVLKNVIAIASGICHGLGYGDNFQAVLVSNALQEIKRFIDAVHPISRDISDSAYLGDLLVTCYSQFSRNRTFGSMIGKGYSIASAQLEMNMIAEGYYAVACIQRINEHINTEMPVCQAVFNVLYKKSDPGEEISRLAERLK